MLSNGPNIIEYLVVENLSLKELSAKLLMAILIVIDKGSDARAGGFNYYDVVRQDRKAKIK